MFVVITFGARRNRCGVSILFLPFLLLFGPQALAAETGWRVVQRGGDVVVVGVGMQEPKFSLKRYAQSLLPGGYTQVESINSELCAIEVDIKPLSILNDALSIEVVYRQVPGLCDPPLANRGYVGVRALHLGDAKAVPLTDYSSEQALLAAFQRAPSLRSLIGENKAITLVSLLDELANHTAGHCDKRLSSAALSQFFVSASGELRLAWSNECGYLADEPKVESFALAPIASELVQGAVAEAFELPFLHLRFEAPKR